VDNKIRVIINCLNITLLLSVFFLSIPLWDLSLTDSISPITAPVTASATNNLTMFFSTYLGGDEEAERGECIAVSDDGCYYVTGRTESNDFPIMNAFDSTYNDGSDVFLSKFSPDNTLLWSTFFGGTDFDGGFCIAVTSKGSCYIVGITRSSDFPTKKAYNSLHSGKDDIFLAKFSSTGNLLWSTYFGGSEEDYGYGIAVAEDGSCYVIGETQSSDLPIKNAYDSTFNGGYFDAFVAKFSSYGRLIWSSYLGGNENEAGKAIAVASDGSCYVTGLTRSSNYPTLNAYDATHNGDWDAFVTKFSSKGKLLWSTFLGGAWWDEALAITVARDGSFYVAGYTVSNNFPTKHAYNTSNGGVGDAFVTRFAVNGSLLWSTFLGGNGCDRAYDVVAAVDCSCYVIGETFSTNFPTPNAYDDSYNGVFDTFITRFATNGSLLWATYLGGIEGSDKGHAIAPSKDGKCYVIGTTHSDDFPIKNAYDPTLGSTSDAFITAFIDPFPPIPYVVPFSPSFYSYILLYSILAFLGITFLVVVIVYTRKK